MKWAYSHKAAGCRSGIFTNNELRQTKISAALRITEVSRVCASVLQSKRMAPQESSLVSVDKTRHTCYDFHKKS
jgi:hypothetical protein